MVNNKSQKLYRIGILSASILTFAVILLGAFTRLTDAGLGCPDWPGCYGRLLVPSDTYAASVFPDSPLEHAKALTEMAHRYLASSLGLVIVGLGLLSVRIAKHTRTRTWILPCALIVLVIFQGLLGMWTVTLKLHPTVVMLHLAGALLLLSLLWWSTLKAYWRTPAIFVVPRLRRLARIALGVVALQIMLGGWTSANYAALSCPDFPTCQQQWLPPLDMRQAFTVWQPLGPNFEGGLLTNTPRVTIHVMHRLGAAITVVVVGLLVAGLIAVRHLRPLGLVVGGLILLQIALGISNVIYLLPLGVALMHTGVAALLLLALVSVNYPLQKPLLPGVSDG